VPRVVDAGQRQRAIADAAFDIARESGLDAVTFRSLAARMGARSTTVITHYAPTREALMQLLAAHVLPIQQRLINEVVAPLDPVRALRVLVDALLPTQPVNRLLARLVFGALPDGAAVDTTQRAFLAWLHASVHGLVAELRPPDNVEVVTELVVMAIAGTTTMALVDPEGWPADRQRSTIAQQLVRLGLQMTEPRPE
jgi:AcrR family transcriptional regulator